MNNKGYCQCGCGGLAPIAKKCREGGIGPKKILDILCKPWDKEGDNGWMEHPLTMMEEPFYARAASAVNRS